MTGRTETAAVGIERRSPDTATSPTEPCSGSFRPVSRDATCTT